MNRPAQYGAPPSPRETQVAIALLFGRSAKRTAHELKMGTKTVNTHRMRLYAKFGAHSATELAIILMRMFGQR